MSSTTLSPDTIHVITTARPRSAAMRTGAVRLTRRGRVVVLLAGLLVALVIGFFLGGGSVATGEAGTPPATEVVLVQPGDTLWGLAAELNTDGDVRATISEIERLNALESGALQVGQRIRVPLAG